MAVCSEKQPVKNIAIPRSISYENKNRPFAAGTSGKQTVF